METLDGSESLGSAVFRGWLRRDSGSTEDRFQMSAIFSSTVDGLESCYCYRCR